VPFALLVKYSHTLSRALLTLFLLILLFNICLNSSMAGTVTIHTSWIKPDKQHGVETVTLKSGEEINVTSCGNVQVQVKDSGAGLSQEQLTQIFRSGVQFNVNDLQAGQGSG